MYSCFFYFPLYISRLFVSSCFVFLSSLLTRLPSDFFCSHPSSSPPPPSSSSSWSCLAFSFKYSRGYTSLHIILLSLPIQRSLQCRRLTTIFLFLSVRSHVLMFFKRLLFLSPITPASSYFYFTSSTSCIIDIYFFWCERFFVTDYTV
jgi:hypothetical protein